MGVPCPGCGREYDVTLFQFGRTIHCTCGRRVGIEPRLRTNHHDRRPRFLADSMLERLARWLRMLGFDCAHEREIDDETLVRRALEGRRIILTRDRSLPEQWRIEDIHVVEARRPLLQLREVVERFELADRIRPFSRCSHCNTELAETPTTGIPRGEAPAPPGRTVPPDVLEGQELLATCRACGRVYWEGSHTARIRRVLREVVGVDAAD